LRQHIFAEVAITAIPGLALAVPVDFVVRRFILHLVTVEIPLSASVVEPRAAFWLVGGGVVALSCVSLLVLGRPGTNPIFSELPLALSGGGTIRDLGWRRALLGVQCAICALLLPIAGLFVISLLKTAAVDLGVDLDHTIQIAMRFPRAVDPADATSTYSRVADRLRANRMVEAVSISEGEPFYSGSAVAPLAADNPQASRWTAHEPAYESAVGAGFFTSIGARLLGRDFTDEDRMGMPPVAIVNKPLALFLWPSTGAVGKCLRLEGEEACVRVVGVTPGVWKLTALAREQFALYRPFAQVKQAQPGAMLVRVRGDAAVAVPEIRRLVQSMTPGLRAASVVPGRDLVSWEFQPWRMSSELFLAFGLLALVIASVGVYAVAALVVARRERHIAIRIALGAEPTDVCRVLLADILPATLVGLVAGESIALLLGRYLRPLLFQTSPFNPIPFAVAGGVLLGLSATVVTARTLRSAQRSVLHILSRASD
jgi:hypothetical protein